MKLWVDDLRLPPEGWEWAKTSREAITALSSSDVSELSLDHDLGGDDTTRAARGPVDVRERGMARRDSSPLGEPGGR
ncbi:MAG: cyclic-phosphate processing receiver domain-containing protein [Rhodococcus sp. (in: high G+C Gram-positive bacteria)]